MDNIIINRRIDNIVERWKKNKNWYFWFNMYDFVEMMRYIFSDEEESREYKYDQWKIYKDIYECESKKDWKQSWKRLWSYEILREKVKDQQLWTAYIYGKKEDWTIDIIYKDVSHVQDYYCYRVLDTIANVEFLDPNDKKKWN